MYQMVSRTDFWNFSRYSCAWAFSERDTLPCIVATAARTAANGCPLLGLLVMVDVVGGVDMGKAEVNGGR